MNNRGVVVKVGGSLFDHPRLFPCLNTWLRTLPPPVLIVPGGGAAADAVRDWHRNHGISEMNAHDIAMASLKASCELFLKMIPESVATNGRSAWNGNILIVDLHDFGKLSTLPKSWSVTTDSLAAEIAWYHQLELILLKSVTIPTMMAWSDAATLGYVDEYFPVASNKLNTTITVINFRAWMADHE